VSSATIALFVVGGALVLLQVILDDLIIRDVCRREGKRYSFLWLYSPNWQMRIFSFDWLEEARRADLYWPRVATFVAFIARIVLATMSVITTPQ
jgi:hypothetical protein